jgi:hypothetical protein
MDPHDDVLDINNIIVTGLVVDRPLLQIVPPEVTLYLSFPLLVRSAYPDHTGALVPIEYHVRCLALGREAERYVGIEAGDALEIRGSLDMTWEGSQAHGAPGGGAALAVRIHELISFQAGGLPGLSDREAEPR